MEGRGSSRDRRRIVRRFEATRLEDSVWALAYEQVWPLLRKVLRASRPSVPAEASAIAPDSASIARSA